MEVLFIILQNHDIQFNNNSLSLRDISSVTETSAFASPYAHRNEIYHVTPFVSRDKASSKSQRQSVGSGEKARQKLVFKQGRESPWVPALTKLFPNGQTDCVKNALYYCAQSINSISWVFFVCSYTTAIVSPLWYLFGSCTKEIHAVRKVSVRYKARPWIKKKL